MFEKNVLDHENEMFVIDRYRKGNSLRSFIKYYVKCFLNVILDVFYKLLFICGGKKGKKKKYHLSICGIFKNEAPYLKEFIEYYRIVGIDHFYMYNNNSDDNYLEVLDSYVMDGIVTLIEWPVVPGQQAAYQHFYDNYRDETNWVAFLDFDEFICPLQKTSIKEWLSKFQRYPLIMIYWKMFGTNGQLEHDNGKLVTEQYINSWPKLDNIGKLIYNTDYDIVEFHVAMMHFFNVWYKGLKIPPINQFGYFVNYDIHRYNKTVDIQCNHYWSKAFANYEAKHKKGSAAWGKSWKTFDKFLLHENHNTSIDFSIRRFLIQLKINMQ